MAMTLSDAGVECIEREEGVEPRAYHDEAGYWTIGVGHLLTKSELASGKLTALGCEWGDGLTAAEVDALFRADSDEVVAALNRLVTVPLTQPQFDALADFVFNVGVPAFAGSTLLKRLNAGAYGAVPEQFMRWVFAAGRPSATLRARRAREVARWLSSDVAPARA